MNHPNDPAPADKIMFQLKTRGPLGAAQVARRLGVTAMAVRQHLYRLKEEGLVDFSDERRSVGRPARIWRLTGRADGRFPDTHADLTVEMLAAARAAFGEKGMERLIAERTRRQLKSYSERMKDCATLEARVAALAAIRREQGYMAEWSRRADGSFLLAENHCPICIAAASCQGLCRDELMLFSRLMGPRAKVERVDHILAGARRCAYLIAPAHPAAVRLAPAP